MSRLITHELTDAQASTLSDYFAELEALHKVDIALCPISHDVTIVISDMDEQDFEELWKEKP